MWAADWVMTLMSLDMQRASLLQGGQDP